MATTEPAASSRPNAWKPPIATLPPSLKGTDGDFTRFSILERLPAILSSTVPHLPTDTAKTTIATLSKQISDSGPILPLTGHHDNDTDTDSTVGVWTSSTSARVDAGHTWMTTDWWFAEHYMYKRILDAIATTPAAPPHSFDPFASHKRDALTAATATFTSTVLPLIGSGDLEAAVLRSLWGNKADLSLSGGKVDAEDVSHSHSHLLVDNTGDLVSALTAAHHVVIVIDNCGLEFLSDLALVDMLLSQESTVTVTLHVKDAPVFVSDVMVKDVETHLEWLHTASPDLEARIRKAMDESRLVVEAHSFYTAPLFMWQAPEAVRSAFSRPHTVAVFKGDANYRRLTGDAHWEHTTDTKTVVSYMPCPAAALRTCKSLTLIGAEKEALETAKKTDPEGWLTTGTNGIVMFVE